MNLLICIFQVFLPFAPFSHSAAYCKTTRRQLDGTNALLLFPAGNCVKGFGGGGNGNSSAEMVSVLHVAADTQGVFLGSNKHSDPRDCQRPQMALVYFRVGTTAYSRAARHPSCSGCLHISSYCHPEISSRWLKCQETYMVCVCVPCPGLETLYLRGANRQLCSTGIVSMVATKEMPNL